MHTAENILSVPDPGNAGEGKRRQQPSLLVLSHLMTGHRELFHFSRDALCSGCFSQQPRL